MLKVLLVIVGLSFGFRAQAADSVAVRGMKIGGVPAIAYDSDTGFRYGAIVNIYQYGTGEHYPDYDYSLYLEWSRTTKGSGTNTIFFDSKYLLPAGMRITGEISYLTEQTLPFFGFNGYEAAYSSDLENEDSPFYISRVYYRHARRVSKVTVDIQKRKSARISFLAGGGWFNTRVDSVDVQKLNSGKELSEQLPDTSTLYSEYVSLGLIPSEEANGGLTNYLKIGLVYDTRDQEANPMRGIWSEILLTIVPDALGNDFAYQLLTVSHRQYFTLKPEVLSFAGRLVYQTQIAGREPFFMLPYIQSSYQTQEGLGGSKTIRGVLKNRVVGLGVVLVNLDLRWKFYRTLIWGQNLYLAGNVFLDAGKVVKKYPLPDSYHPTDSEGWHQGYGFGFRIALNENFIVALDYGKAKDPRDGTQGVYIGLGYLF